MNRACRIFVRWSAFAAAVSMVAWGYAAEQQASKPDRVNYARPFEPPTRPGADRAAARRGRAGRLASRLVPRREERLHRPHGRVP